MSLPLAIDVAIGLLFIYLILSLLTSEIQELIGTVLQWRATHLKKSVENLLTDDELATNLYKSPLIKALNQEAKGRIEVSVRKISQVLMAFYNTITRTKNVFGSDTSGPSYIPSETFSVALLQKINIEGLSLKISEVIARRFSYEKLKLIQEMLSAVRNNPASEQILRDEFTSLRRSLDDIIDDLSHRRLGLADAVQQAREQLSQFIDNTEKVLGDQEVIRTRLPYIKQALTRMQTEPTVTEVLRLIFAESERNGAAADDTERDRALSARLSAILSVIRQENPELLQQVTDLPQPLKQTLLALAEQAQIKAEGLESSVRQLQKEVATWFDNSMARASGVYRRNSKGIAILLGFVIAVSINADTLYIISRLSKDTTLRTAVSEAANQVVPADGTSSVAIATDLQSVKDAVNGVLDELPLPIGWDAVNTEQQTQQSQTWRFPFLRKLVGWMITGIALSMGASFWYDLLGKIVRVRNTGGTGKSESSK
ncbi:MAG TPA: hypothetical protein V6C88_02395 [Chroococcidiopsis sp.]